MMSTRWIRLLLFVLSFVGWIGRGGLAHAAERIVITPDSPQPIDLGSVRVSNNAANPVGTQVFTIKNTGNQDLTVNTSTFSNNAEYKLNPVPSFPLTIIPNGQTTVTVEFNPTMTGTRTSTMTVPNSDS